MGVPAGLSLAAAPAFVSVVDVRLSSRVAGALHGLDLNVTQTASIGEIASLADEAERCVIVFDRSDQWLRDIARVCDAVPGALPILVGDISSPDEFLASIAAGVVGFCEADADVDAIARTVQSVLGSGVAIPRPFVAPLVAEVRAGRGHVVRTAAGDITVTDREWEILKLLLQRRSTREMADALFVSVGTVRSHVSALLRKLGAADRDDAIAMVERGRRTS